jgi:hypothetical protein
VCEDVVAAFLAARRGESSLGELVLVDGESNASEQALGQAALDLLDPGLERLLCTAERTAMNTRTPR